VRSSGTSPSSGHGTRSSAGTATRYIPGQRLYVADTRPDDTADVVVRNEDPAAPVLERVGGRALSPETGRPAR